jgi:hypothetical protein
MTMYDIIKIIHYHTIQIASLVTRNVRAYLHVTGSRKKLSSGPLEKNREDNV